MKKNITEEIEIPEGTNVDVDGRAVICKKDNLENKRIFENHFEIKKQENKIVLNAKKATKNEKKMIMTVSAHIKNMLKGLNEKFVYELQVGSVHFPMNLKIENNVLSIGNFLGETKPRKVKLRENVDVKIEKDIIKVSSHDIELAGMTAAEIERATKIRHKDRRVFQDGIFITKKPGEGE